MDENIKSLKILKEIVNVDEIVGEIDSIKGVLKSKIEVKSGFSVLFYAIDQWASDYDVMVKIMNILYEQFSLDSEPYFGEDGDEGVYTTIADENDTSIETFDSNDSEECNEDAHPCECQDCCHNDHAEGEGCCGHTHISKTEQKVKFVELGVAILVFIVGLILKSITTTQTWGNYVLLLAYVISGYEILFEGLFNVFKGKIFSENLLMTIASLSAILLGEVAEACGIMILFSIGESFEHVAVDRSKSVIEKLKNLSNHKVKLLKEDGTITQVKPSKVSVGSVYLLHSGDKALLDGVILEGSGSFDTKTVTGESLYKDLGCGDEIFGGYSSVNGTVKVKVLKDEKNSTLAKIAEIVSQSASKKSKKETFISKFARIYTPIVVIVAILVAFIPPIFSQTYVEGLKVWGVRAVMVLCVSCPCSLVISVPLVYYVGVGACAEKGVLVKATATLEKMADIETVVFDKTGTITNGELKVTKVISTKNYVGKVLHLVAVAEQFSSHPIALAIKNKVGEINEEVECYTEFAGEGVVLKYKGKQLIVGNKKLIEKNGVKPSEIAEIGTKLYVIYGGEYAGAVVLNDTIKDEAYGTVLELKDLGVKKTVLLTGDNKEYASAVRKELKMNMSASNLMPQDKVKEIELLIEKSNGKAVAFVGDGVNDAPVIMRADVGVSMGNLGSDVAVESSDVVVTDDNLSKIPYAIKIAKRTSSIAWQNVISSIVVKTAVMVLGIVGVTSSLWLAIGSDVGMLIITILNSVRNKIKIR